MTSTRPPLPQRWEYTLGVGLLALLLRVLQSRHLQRRAAVSGPDAEPSAWELRRQAEQSAHPWLAQLDRERAVGQAVLAFWLAWRSFRLERAAQRDVRS